jgi:ubiquinone/menaquinone biosynthesis C-methylase UbiE
LAGQVDVTQGNVRELPFGDATFDSVVSTFPTEYIADPIALHEIARVLRPGGRLIVVVGANLLPIGPLHFLLILLHALVYGGSPRPALRQAERVRRQNQSASKDSASSARAVQDERTFTSAGPRIPLEAAGLRRVEERVGNRAWEAFIILGERAEERKGASQRLLH